jgi:hypothetical protein
MGLRRFRQTPLAVFLKYEHFLAMQEKILKSEEGVRPLFSFGGFAHDPQRVLSAVHQFAPVGSEHLRDFRIRVIPRSSVDLNSALHRSHTPMTGGGDFLTIRSLRSGMSKV